MSRLLEGKSALITGAGGGIGRATAVMFAREGARIAVSDISREALEETARLIGDAGGEAIAVVADITKDADVAAMVAATVAAFGRLDCAFNNAGVNGSRSALSDRKLPNGRKRRSTGWSRSI